MTRRVVIIGGGVSGLAAAEALTRIAPSASVELLEASNRFGGHIRTEVTDGYVMEAGPDVVLASKPAAIELARRVGLGDRIQGTNAAVRGSYILRRGKLVRIPDGITGLVPSRMTPFVTSPLLSPIGKLRVAADFVLPRRATPVDESIESFVVRRLGREMYERLAEPLLSGISAGNGASLSMPAMFPALFEYEQKHGGLIRGMLAEKRRARVARTTAGTATPVNGSRPASAFLSFPDGLEELTAAVEKTLRLRGVTLRTGIHVQGIRRGAEQTLVMQAGDGGEIAADAVILAVPTFVAAPLVRSIDESLASRLDEVDYTSTVTVSVAYRSADVPRALDATGYVVPRTENRAVLACTWTSAKFTGRAPEGRALFRCFLGGASRGSYVDRSDAELLDIVRKEMREVMGVVAEPLLVRINRFERALAQYNVGHLDRVARIREAAEALPGLALAGSVYRGIGIPDCVRSGEEAAARIASYLTS